MADPLSITFGVIGTIAVIVRSTIQLKTFIDSIEGAPVVISSFSTDLGSLSTILQNLETTIRDPDFAQVETRARVIGFIDEPLKNCNEVLNQIIQKLLPFVKVGAEKSKWRLFRWAFREKDFRDAKLLLLAHKSSLEIALSTTNL